MDFNLCSRGVKDSRQKEYLTLRNAERGFCERVYIGHDKEKGNMYEDKEEFLYLHGTSEQKRKYHTWDMNPVEWFAEDFRYLFGVDKGDKFWGHPIAPPGNEIKEFMLSL